MTGLPSWMIGAGDKVDLKSASASERQPFRFWMKAGSNKQIIFLTNFSDAAVIYEHTFQGFKNGKMSWQQATCLAPTGKTCPLCVYSDNYGKAGRQAKQLFTVLDMTPWEGKADKKQHKYSKVMLAAGFGVQEVLLRKYAARIDAGHTWRGARFNVFRSNDAKSPGVGNDYEYMKQEDLGLFPPDDVTQLDLASFAPSVEKLKRIVATIMSGSSYDEAEPAGTPAEKSEEIEIDSSEIDY